MNFTPSLVYVWVGADGVEHYDYADGSHVAFDRVERVAYLIGGR